MYVIDNAGDVPDIIISSTTFFKFVKNDTLRIMPLQERYYLLGGVLPFIHVTFLYSYS